MVQVISDEFGGNVFGRLGKGLGKGLSEQLPKEVERGRLAAGLRNLEQEKNLDPMQFFTRALSIPGMTPQAIESLGKLAKHRMQAEGLKGMGERGKEFPRLRREEVEGAKGEAPSLTTRTPLEATLKPYIPMGKDEINLEASQLYEENPGFFQHEPQRAIDYVVQQDEREQARNAALEGQRSKEQNVQKTITDALRHQSLSLGTKVPSNVYSQVEDKAINAVRSKADGGEGLTEQEAMKKYGKELDSISRDYNAIPQMGNWSVITRKAGKTLGVIKSLQSKFAERDDLENFAQTIESENKISPGLAYSLAYPISSNKQLSGAINSITPINKTNIAKAFLPGQTLHTLIGKGKELLEAPQIERKTQEISKKLAPLLGKNGSPLAVGEELKNKGYDPETWMNYLRKNRNSLGLTEIQGRELDKTIPDNPPLNDLWLKNFAGLNKEAQ